MSYWPELLIENYHALMREAEMLYRVVHDLSVTLPANSMFLAGNVKVVADSMVERANRIKKRMKSLGYYDCWEREDNMEVEVP